MLHNKFDEIRLLICGDGKSVDIEQMNQYIKQHQMEEYVQYMGFQKDMNRWYRSIHCLVAPSQGYIHVKSNFTIAKMVDSIDKIVSNLR